MFYLPIYLVAIVAAFGRHKPSHFEFWLRIRIQNLLFYLNIRRWNELHDIAQNIGNISPK